jgi:phage terminase large subunit
VKRIVKSSTSEAQIDKFWMRKFNLTQFLFDKQLEFVEDTSPFKVAVCSRRSGKTVACAAHLIHTAINTPNIICLYITLSRNNAKKIIWRDIRNINTEYKLDGVTDETEMSMTFKNGATIYLSGCKDQTEVEKFRGLPIKLCYIDECQSFREYIKDLIDDVIAPALMDYAGSLCLIGTPGPVPTGYFHECAVESEVWAKHYWTFWDNPFISSKSGKTHQELLDRELKRRGVTAEDPSIQREWFGKWVLDSDSLLINYDINKNNFHNLPELPNNSKYNYLMGIDIGFKDADAIAILAWSDHTPTTYLVEEMITEKQGLTELVNQVQTLQKKYDVHKIVMDMGGLGLKMGEEMIRRHQIPVEAAEKARKMENVAFLNDSLRSGRFKAKANSRFAQDSYLVEIDRDKTKPDKIVVSDRFHSDIIDSVLYAFKLSPAYAYQAPDTNKPKWGTKEWALQRSTEMWEKELEGYQKENEPESEYNNWLKGK